MITLGINYSQMHDSSACIVRDGELLFAVAEERLSRVKHDARFPELAIRACLEFAGVRAEQLDEVCFGWQTAGPVYQHDLKLYALGQWPVTYPNVLNSTRQFLSMWHQESGGRRFVERFGATKVRRRFVDHHLAHAISAYAYSGFEESAVVVMDGRGAWEATSIWRGADGRLEHLLTIPFPDSLGLFYSAFTEYLGFQPNSDEWKVMGLAPYGEPGVKLDAFIDAAAAPYRVFAKRLPIDGNASSTLSLLGAPRKPESDIDARHKNLAYAVQDACEKAMMNVVRVAIAKTRCRNLCLAHAFFYGTGAWRILCRSIGLTVLQPGRLRARSCRPFLPAPHRTGRDTCRIIRLSGFLVSLTLAYWNGCRHDSVCRAECSCVFGIS